MNDYKFRDEYYKIEWLNIGGWRILQLIDTICILLIYSPFQLKNVLSFPDQIQNTTEHQGNEEIEMEDVDIEDDQYDDEEYY